MPTRYVLREVGALGLYLFVVFAAAGMEIFHTYREHDARMELFRGHLVAEAKAHFDNMVMTRTWNASHGGVYVRQTGGLKPNPYLHDNVLKTDTNETLIRVNPAWMTRQISELTNRHGGYYYKITSLKPLNPSNKPDRFEIEALKFFEANPGREVYYRFDRDGGVGSRFDFMGALITQQACLECHAQQGYRVGDVRGGIRVTIPTEDYAHVLEQMQERRDYVSNAIFFVGMLFAAVGAALIHLLFAHQARMRDLNTTLEEQVRQRTEQLRAVNETLEKRVEVEVAKNRQKEELMVAQSRHAAMGEMIGMIAHQWRQPVSTIAMSVENLLLDAELGELDMREFQVQGEAILHQTSYLSKTIDDFRNFFRHQENAEVCEAVDVLNEALQITGSSLSHHDVSYVVENRSSLKVRTFSRDLLQIYINIINNAKEALVERRSEGRQLHIEVYDVPQAVVTKICDNAGGIDASILPKIFEPYFSTKLHKEGSGLGLYMSRIIAEKHLGGRVWAENGPEGACFYVRIVSLEEAPTP